MTPTFYNQHNGIRAAFVNWKTNETDVQLIFDMMNSTIEQLK
jgi:hypothetical protein